MNVRDRHNLEAQDAIAQKRPAHDVVTGHRLGRFAIRPGRGGAGGLCGHIQSLLVDGAGGGTLFGGPTKPRGSGG